MLGPFGMGGPRLLAKTVKVAVVIAALSFLAAEWLSKSGLDRQSLARLTGQIARLGDDPAVTGSLAEAAHASRLDPCSVQRRSGASQR